MKDIKLSLPLVIIICLAVGGASFYGGTLMSKKSTSNFQGQFSGMANRTGNATGRATNGKMGNGSANGGMINGEILKLDDNTVTIKLSDGSSKIVYLSADTTISKFTEATKQDLEIGKTVMINAKTDTSGNQTAQFIQLRPANSPDMPGGNRPSDNNQPTSTPNQK